MIPTKRKARGNKPPGRLLLVAVALGLMPLAACEGEAGEGTREGESSAMEARPVDLGPVDGFDLPATDLERVAVGSMAPDFSLQTLDGDTLTLSSFRGAKNVILVFYRGHW